MDGVVAVVDVGTTVFTELDLELNATARPESPDVLALEVLGVGERSATAIHGNTFFEVKVDRMIPAAAAIDVGPVFDVTRLRVDQRNAIGVHGVSSLAVDHHGPRESVRLVAIRDALAVRLDGIAGTGPAPLHDALADRRDDRNLLGEHARNDARIRIGRIQGNARSVDTRHAGCDLELHDATHGWIVLGASQRLTQRNLPVGHAATGLLERVHQRDLVSDPEGREVHDDV